MYIPGLWTHKWRPIQFTLVVDNFGVIYVGQEHTDHLLQTLNRHCHVSTDWEGRKYCGLILDWDYRGEEVYITMPCYVKEALQNFNHPTPCRKQDQLHPPQLRYPYSLHKGHGQTPLPPEGKKFIQHVTGDFLFYARAVDSMMLTALIIMASEHAHPTGKDNEKVSNF